MGLCFHYELANGVPYNHTHRILQHAAGNDVHELASAQTLAKVGQQKTVLKPSILYFLPIF